MKRLQIANKNRDSKIIAFTSTLIDDTINVEDVSSIYLRWKQIEMAYNSTICTTLRCYAVEK